MKTLLELLDAWEDGALGAEDVAELKRLLANPEARAELVGDWLLHGAIYERLREEKAAKEAAALLAANAPAPSRESAGVPPPVWRRLFRRPAGTVPGAAWRKAALAAGVVLAALVGWQLFKTPKPEVARVVPPPAPALETRIVAGVLTATNGAVWVRLAGQTNANQVAGAQLTLYSGDTLQTGSNTLARFTYPDGSALAIYSNTRLSVGLTNSALRLEVEYGAVDAVILPQPPGHDMLATTKFMRSDILGTEFRLMADTQSAWLGVRKGKIEVTRVADGMKVVLLQSNYAAVHPGWPYMRMNATLCSVWKGVCQKAAGSAYP
jgi:hypothetical protein